MSKKLNSLDVNLIRKSIVRLKKKTDSDVALEFAERMENIATLSNFDLNKWFVDPVEFYDMQRVYRRVMGNDQLTVLTWEDLN